MTRTFYGTGGGVALPDKQTDTREKRGEDFFGEELLSKMAGGPTRPHEFRFRRRNFDKRTPAGLLDRGGFSEACNVNNFKLCPVKRGFFIRLHA